MRLRALCTILLLAACGDDSTSNNLPDGSIPDGAADAPCLCDAPIPDAPATPDGGTDAELLMGIAGVRTAADQNPTGGAASVDVTDVLVTFLKPALGTEPAGFFVQDQPTGPAVFIAVDPASLSPAAAVGDQVSFSVTMVAKTGSLREATAITSYVRGSTGNDVSALLTDVSSAADLVANLDAYESRLIRLTGTLASNFAGAGGGAFSSAQLTTAGLTDPNLKLRLPTSVQQSMDLANACAVTLNAGPMWRFNAQAQPSAFAASDLTVTSCPAPRVTGAVPSNSTTLIVHFDRLIDSATVHSDGSDFTFDNGLLATAATVNGRDVTVTTTAQVPSTSYMATVAQTVTDTRGTALDSAAATASFTGYVQLATLVINEVNPNLTGNADLIELRVTGAGSVANMTVELGIATPTVLATLPNLQVAADDLIVVHLTPPTGVITETLAKNQCANAVVAACYDNAWDVAGASGGIPFSHRVLLVRAPAGTIVDAVPFVNTTVSAPPAAFPGDLQTLQAMGLWLPADCGGSPCTYTSTPTAQSVSASWTGSNATTSAQRTANTQMASDWHVTAQSFGAANQ